MNLQTFAKILRANYVPSYAYPRIEPTELWDYFKPGRVVKERTIGNKKEILILDKKAQISIWNRLLNIKRFDSMNIVISSEINDYLAHEVAAMLNLHWVRRFSNLQWKWVTTAWRQEKVDLTCKVLFIRSVLPIEERLYNIRDLIDYHPNALVVLIIGGITGIEFFDDYLSLPLHAALHIEGTLAKLPTFYLPRIADSREFVLPKFVIPTSIRNSYLKEKILSKE